MKDDKIKPLIGLVSIALAAIIFLTFVVFIFVIIGIEVNKWEKLKSYEMKVSEAKAIAQSSDIIGQSIQKNPAYLTYLKTIKK